MYPGQRRRKKRYTHGVKSVEVTRGKNGYGFTISGQQPCILSCIVSGSPADRAGLKTGDYLMSVNNLNVSKASHDDVVRLIGSSSGLLVLQIAENCNDSDSSDEEFQSRPKSKYPNRVRFRQTNRNDREPSGMARDKPTTATNRYAGLIQKNSSQGKTRSRSPGHERFGRELDHMATQDHQDRMAFYQPHTRGVENVNPLSVSVYPGRQKHLNGVGPPPGVKVRTGTHGGKHTIITREARLVKTNNNPEVYDPVHGPNQAFHHGQPPQSFTPQDLSNILFPSFQPHVNRGHVHVNDHDEEGELSDGSGEPNLRVVVGYVGSIEMPRDANLPNSRLQSIRSAVRRLRIEHKVHTLVLMLIFPGGVRMTNTMGSTVAHYPAEKVAFSGVCPDDRRFFGIVTLHGASSDEISSDNGSVEDFMSGSSCHVFMIDPELRSHSAHMQKARSFGIQCTVDPVTHRCLEFPKSCTVILRNVAKLYRDRQGGLYEAEIANANGLAAGNYMHAPQASDISNSSNSDSGLGFCREDSGNDPVYVVEMPQEENLGAEGDHSRWELEQSVFSTPNHGHSNHSHNNHDHSVEEADVAGVLASRCQGSGASNHSPSSQANTSNSSNEQAMPSQRGPFDRLNLRAMPDPRGIVKDVSQDVLDSQNSADNLRRSMHKLLQSRQRRAESSSDVESLRSNESSHSGANGSQTNLSRSDSVQSQLGFQSQPVSQPPLHSKSGNLSHTSLMGTSGNFSLNSSSVSSHLEVSRNSSANDSKLSPRATVGKKSGAVPLPVQIPSVPDPPVGIPELLSETNNAFHPTSPIPNKPPIPERRPVVPRNQPRTPVQPPKPASERPKSTPPIPSLPPIAMEEEYDSDPGNVSGIGPLAGEEEQWGGKIEDHKEEVQENRRFSEGFITQKKREKDQELHRKLNKGGSFKQLRNKRRPTLSNSHESLVASETSEFSRPQKLNGAASITSVAHEIRDDENGNDTTGRAATWALSFEKLLQDKAGLATFTEFLKKEFSEENIQFWCDCEAYKKLSTQEERKARGRELFDRHLSEQATDAINIDSHARRVTEQGLDNAAPELLDVAKKQIFTLMKQDSYSRFLKSDLYKQCVVAEIEGKALPFPGEDIKPKEEKRMMKKSRSASSSEGDEKRRKSLLLPWNRNKSDKRLAKVTTDPDLHRAKEEGGNIPVTGSLDLVDLSLISKEISPSHMEVNPGGEVDLSKDKFCRVILPDGSTTVMFAKTGQSIYAALRRLCDRRNMNFVSMEVFIVGSERPLDLTKDISTLGSKEIKMEKRVLFRVDLPNHKVIGVKAKPNRNIKDVFRPILMKYGFRIESMVIHVASTGTPLHLDTEVSTIEGQRISVQTLEDFTGQKRKQKEWGGFGRHRGQNGKPPLPRSRSALGCESLEDITNQIFKDLMEGKADAMQQFDELGILDPDKKVDDKGKTEENRNSGLFGFIRRNSIGDKDKNRMKAKPSLNLQRPKPPAARPYRKDPEEDRFFELLSRVQGHRLDDQRGLTADQLELPEFLRTEQLNADIDQTRDSPARRLERRNSDSSIMDFNPESRKLSRSLSQEGDIDRNSRTSNIFGTPNSKIPYVDQSFSSDGVMPSHGEAENYFSEAYKYPGSPDFNDSKLMEKSLRDIGIGQTSQSSIQANTPISKLPYKLSPRAKTPVPRSKPPAPPVPVSRRKLLGNHSDGEVQIPGTTSSDLNQTLLNTNCHSPLPPPPCVPDGPPIEDEAPNYPPPTPLVGSHHSKGADKTRSQSGDQKGNIPVPARRYKKRSQSATRANKNTPINSLLSSHPVGFVTDSEPEADSDSTNQSLELSNVRLSVSTPSPTTHDLVLGTESSPEGINLHPRAPPRRSRKTSRGSTSSLSSPEDQDIKQGRILQHRAKDTPVQVSFV